MYIYIYIFIIVISYILYSQVLFGILISGDHVFFLSVFYVKWSVNIIMKSYVYVKKIMMSFRDFVI